MRTIFALFIAATLAGCQTTAAPSTASGKPEITIRAPVGTVKALILSRSIDQRFNITKDTEYLLQVDKPSDNFAAAVLLGSRYDGTPNERIIFTFAPLGEEVRVVASTMFVTNPGSAFEQITPINAGEGVNRTQSTLSEIKQKAESMNTVPPSRKRADKRT